MFINESRDLITTSKYVPEKSLQDDSKNTKRPSSALDNKKKIMEILKNLSLKQQGIHSNSFMQASGFEYTGKGDTVRCKHCDLEVSDWTKDMDPFAVHSSCRPDCSFVCSMKLPNSFKPSSFPIAVPTGSTSLSPIAAARNGEQENPSKRQKIESSQEDSHVNSLLEVDKTQQIRRRTFSHWPHRTVPSSSQMIEAGFFNCNVGDRVICIYCDLICQQWTPHTDEPSKVHKILSPNCIYVKSKLIRRDVGSLLIVNEPASGNRSEVSNNSDQFRCSEFVLTAACNAAYVEMPRRTASFATWPSENMPSVDDLVRAGFFFTGTKSIVTCFYCNGSLQNWGANDNPTIEHARWFPHCAYARQLCGDELYRKIQESKRAQQERARANEQKGKVGSVGLPITGSSINGGALVIPDESTLSRLVAARLDLAVSQGLLTKGFKLSIIKRCWEDQLRLKKDDFVSDSDLYMACLILQKQIERIDGKKENIVVPSVKMKQIEEAAEKERIAAIARELAARVPCVSVPSQSTPTTTSSGIDVEMTAVTQSETNKPTLPIKLAAQTGAAITGNQKEINAKAATTSNMDDKKPTADSSPVNPCSLCLSEEKRLACIPCGHLATCVPCGHSLRSCPICRREIEAFVRIYI